MAAAALFERNHAIGQVGSCRRNQAGQSQESAPNHKTSYALRPRTKRLEAILGGWTSKKIAEHYGISPNTVSAHRLNLGRKFGVSHRVALIRAALRYGMLEM